MLEHALVMMPLDLDTFSGSERVMSGTRHGAAFNRGIRAYLRAAYAEAIEHFKAALIAVYADGEEQAQTYQRERAVIYMYSGNAWAFLEQWQAALGDYSEAVQADARLAEASYNLGVARAALGQIQLAIAAFQATLALNSTVYEAHFSLGRCYQKIDNAGQAYLHYRAACVARPQAAEPLYYLGLFHQHHGALRLAQQYFDEALRVEPTFIAPVQTPDLPTTQNDRVAVAWYYRLSQELKQEGHAVEAIPIYRALLAWKPDEHTARYLLGNLLARNRQWEAALETFEAIPPTDEHYIDVRLRMSAVLRMLKRLEDAYKVLVDCAKRYPTNGGLFLQIGKLLYDLERPLPAVRAMERAVELLPHDAQAHYLLGFLYMLLERENWALAAWRKAIALAPDSYSLRYDLGYIYVRRGRYVLAANEFAQVLAHTPDDSDTSFMLGVCYKEMIEPARAIPLFESVLRHDPQHAQALYYLGACYLQIGNTSLGKAYLRRYDHLSRQEATATPRAALPRRPTPAPRS